MWTRQPSWVRSSFSARVWSEVESVAVYGEEPEREFAHPPDGREAGDRPVAGQFARRADAPDLPALEQRGAGQLVFEVGDAVRGQRAVVRRPRVQEWRAEVEPGDAAVRQRDGARTQPPAAVPALVDDGDFDVARQQAVRGGQPRQAPADDRDPRRHGLPQSRLTFSASANTRMRFPPSTLWICSFVYPRSSMICVSSG